MSELKKALKKICRECLQVLPQKAGFVAQNAAQTRFAGPAYAEAGETAPVCSECGEKLSFIFQFFPALGSNVSARNHLLVFYYCFRCMPIGSNSEEPGMWLLKSYQDASSNKFIEGIGVDSELQPFLCVTEKAMMLPDYETIEDDYPEIAELCELEDGDEPVSVYEDAGQEIGCTMEPFTSIGGYPIWIQGKVEPLCPICSQEMEFIAQIDSEQEVGLMWGDAGCVYLFRCSEHIDQFGMEMQCF